MIRSAHPRIRAVSTGLTLVELMIALTVGLVVLLGMSTLFSHVLRNQTELERSIRTLESGRYSVEMLVEDIMHAGYYSDFNPNTLFATVAYTTPDPCAVDVSALGWSTPAGTPSTIQIPVPAQGIGAGAAASCLTNRRAGTQAIILRQAEAISVETPTTTPVLPSRTDNLYIQVSRCNTDPQRILVSPGPASNFSLHQADCATVNPVTRRLIQRTYYVANCDNCIANDGIPTLKRVEMVDGVLQTISVAVGIDNLQFEYGIDNSPSNGDGQPDEFVTVAGVTDWSTVVAVRLHLLARATEITPGYADQRTYELGPGVEIDKPADGFKRNLMSTTVRLVNVGGRKE